MDVIGVQAHDGRDTVGAQAESHRQALSDRLSGTQALGHLVTPRRNDCDEPH